MDKAGFRQYLQTRDMAEEAIEASLWLVELFEDFLNKTGRQADPGSVHAFSKRLIAENRNTLEHYIALARYGYFMKNSAVYVAVVEMLDGHEAMENLHKKLGEAVGAALRDEVFSGIDLPPLGTPSTENPPITQVVMERLEHLVDPAVSRRILIDSLRDLSDEWYREEKTKYEACADLDAYLEQKGRDYIQQLEQIKADGRLYFTQEITDDVIAFVQQHPEIRQGVRVGNVIYEIKIPCMTKEYLAETDEKLKRYYYCHCPWVRESLRTGDVQISPKFCQCSVGFHKKPWEMIFEQPLDGEIVESVLQGDPWCKIAIYLPEHVGE